jgi:hypothetical protein
MLSLVNVLKQTKLAKIISLGVILVLSLSAFVGTSLANLVTYAGVIGESAPTMSVDPFCGTPNQPYVYEGILSVSLTGPYEYNDTSYFGGSYDSVMLLYTTPIDPSNTSANLAVKIDDYGMVNLTAGVAYYMYITPYCSRGFGNYGFTFEGAGTIGIGAGIIGSPTATTGVEAVISDIVYPSDNRINWQYGDLSSVLYATNGGIAVYCYSDTTWLAFFVDQSTVDAWDTTQAQDIPVVEVNENDCRAAFYILDSGEYQINLWSKEGKLYEIIADNLEFQNATKRYTDLNES